jgi:hypothetical protein
MSPEERAAAAVVLDVEQERMTCPACLAEFATGPARCPECGLRFG